MKLDLDYDKAAHLIETIEWEEAHRFTDINNELSWSKATVSKYLTELTEKGFLEKKITSDGNPGYFVTQKGNKFKELHGANVWKGLYNSKEEAAEFLERENQFYEALEEQGLFDSGLDQNQVFDLMKEHHNDISHDDIDFEEPTILMLWRFLSIFVERTPIEFKDKRVDFNIKIESDLGDLEIDVEEMKNLMEEFDSFES